MGTEIKKKVVLVTGCGAGVGLELVKQLSVLEDYIVIATTRSHSYMNMQEQLMKLPQFNQRLFTKLLDVTSAKQIKKVISQIDQQFDGVDILINNAAVCMLSTIEDYTEDLFERALKVNFYGALNLCKEVLPKMRRKNFGKIINISSVSGFVSLPSLGLYSVTKYALEAFSKALHSELAGTNIKVAVIQPGLIANGAHKKIITGPKVDHSINDSDSEGYFTYFFMTKLMNFYRSKMAPNSTQIAERIVRVVESRLYKFNNRITFDSQLLFFTKVYVPSFIKNWVLSLLMSPVGAQLLPGESFGDSIGDHSEENAEEVCEPVISNLKLNPR